MYKKLNGAGYDPLLEDVPNNLFKKNVKNPYRSTT